MAARRLSDAHRATDLARDPGSERRLHEEHAVALEGLPDAEAQRARGRRRPGAGGEVDADVTTPEDLVTDVYDDMTCCDRGYGGLQA